MRVALTDVFVRAAKPPGRGSITVFDTTFRGLCLRISAGGTKSFCLLHGKERTRRYIGKYPAMSLADARTTARRMLSEQALGIVQRQPSITFAEALELFLAQSAQRNRPRTTDDYRRLLTRHFLPVLGQKDLANIRTQDITRIVDRLLPTPSECRHAFVAGKVMFRWAARRSLTETNPCEHLYAPTKATPRERVLTDDELRQIILRSRMSGYQFGTVLQLLILTGQRRTEIGSLRWEWIDQAKRTITLPGMATKNKRAHTFPYGQMTSNTLATIPRLGSYLFPGSRGSDAAMTGWSNFKAAFDKTCPIVGWTLHDLRRTFATNLAALGVRLEVTEKLLNHVSGSFGGIVGVYQRHSFQDEMRVAMGLWEAKISQLLESTC
jgi:integrase